MSALTKWHTYIESPTAEALSALLADDVVFESPVVHTPQVGKDITFKYLSSAAMVLGGSSFTPGFPIGSCRHRARSTSPGCPRSVSSIRGGAQNFRSPARASGKGCASRGRSQFPSKYLPLAAANLRRSFGRASRL